jgi:UrcA family protein
LDVSTNEGAAMLLRRIKAAAKQVCGDPFDFRDLTQKAQVRRCYAQAVARAVSAVEATKLTEVYRQQSSTARLE